VLQGRRSECGTLNELLQAVCAGESRTLLVRGEPGVGKSALLEHLVERASASAPGCRVVRAAGVQSEMELPFAGLHQLCGSLLDHLERLPEPQRDALGTAFGLRAGDAPDRFFAGLGVLSLLCEVAEARPLVCVVDDAHWLDRASAQALAFAARRLAGAPVAMVFAVREPAGELAGLPELPVEGLAAGDARALLASVIAGPLDEGVRDRIVAETRGNPLALLELPRELPPAELAGGFGLLNAPALSGRIEDSFLRRLEGLPVESQRLLLVAAVEPAGDSTLVWRAAERLGIGTEAAAPAEAAGLCEFGDRVRFRHPLVRSAVHRAAPSGDQQAVHGALAEVTDPAVDPDRRAWHRAHAAPGLDEEVAAELERSAGRAQARGGFAAAAAFLERSARLTLDPERRAARALAAAQAKHLAGAPDEALDLLATSQAGPLDELSRARAALLRGQIAFMSRRGRDSPPLLLTAAKLLEPLDARLARETYLDALWAAWVVGRQGGGAGLTTVANAARAASPAPQPAQAADLLLDGWLLLITEGYAAGVPVLQRALSAFRGADITADEELRWLGIASKIAVNLWDEESRDVLTCRHVQLARDAGALAVLPGALTARVGAHVTAGELGAAAAVLEEAEAITAATGSQRVSYPALGLAAWRGREAEASKLFATTAKEVVARGEGVGLTAVQWASAVLHNGLGRYDDALAAAQRAAAHPEQLWFSTWALVELIEAAARSGQPERGADALRRLSETTRASGTQWALGIEARSRALLSDGDAADELYREAIDRLAATSVRGELARAHLLYGEWLRRERRRIEARDQLRTAYELFTAMGIEAFGARAGRELLATGETARKRNVETSAQLTARELQIAWLAREGLSNPEIGARLFISARTVEYHLHKVFAKLDISSRTQLHRVLVTGSGADAIHAV
jgi:DNA-binding CsgD family transcriptional regulator